MTSTKPILIIGGGIMGLWLADDLARAHQLPVVLVEQGSVGSGTSGRGAGGLAIHQATHLDAELSGASLRAYFELASETDMRLTRKIGRLTIAGLQYDTEWASALVQVIQSSGYSAEVVSAEEMKARIPRMNTSTVDTGVWSEPDSFLRIPDAIGHLKSRITKHGGRIVEHAHVDSILIGDQGATGIILDGGDVIEGSTVVVAAGATSSRLLEPVGYTTATKSFRTQALVVQTEPDFLWPAVRDFTAQYYAIPQSRDTILIGGGNHPVDPAEDPFSESPVDDWFPSDIFRQFENRFPGASDGRALRSWSGVVHTTPDDQPLIGQISRVPGLWVACGLTGRGVGRAPALGSALASMIVGAESPHDLSPFDANRFIGHEDFELDVVRRVP